MTPISWAQGVGGSNPLAPTIFNSLATGNSGTGSEPHQNRRGANDRNKTVRT